MIEAVLTQQATELYCSFWLEGHWFGVPARWVREVHAPTVITPIPGAPPTVLGYVNLRGQLILVLDPRELLLGAGNRIVDDAHWIVFKPTAGEAFAIQTGQVEDIVAVHREQVDVPKSQAEGARASETGYDNARLTVGHAKLDRALLTLIDPRELLPAAFHGFQMRYGGGKIPIEAKQSS